MNYVNETINGKDYKFRLTIEKACELEDKLGKNPLMIFATDFPRITDLKNVFIYAGGSDELLQQYFDDGHIFKDLIALVMEIFRVSGFARESEEKNA